MACSLVDVCLYGREDEENEILLHMFLDTCVCVFMGEDGRQVRSIAFSLLYAKPG